MTDRRGRGREGCGKARSREVWEGERELWERQRDVARMAERCGRGRAHMEVNPLRNNELRGGGGGGGGKI